MAKKSDENRLHRVFRQFSTFFGQDGSNRGAVSAKWPFSQVLCTQKFCSVKTVTVKNDLFILWDKMTDMQGMGVRNETAQNFT